MSIGSKEKPFIFSFIAITAILMAITPFLSLGAGFTFLLLALYLIFIISLVYHRIGLFLFILARPCLDYFSEDILLKWGEFSFNLASIFAILVIIFTAFVIIKNIKKLPKNPLLKPWLFFLLIVFISFIFSINPSSSLREATRLISIFFLFLSGFILIKNYKDLASLIKVIVISALIPTGLAFYQHLTEKGISLPLENLYNRIYGTFSHPNLLAFYLVVILSLAVLIFLVSNKKKISIIGYGILLIFFSIILVLTYTRGAWIGFFIVLLVAGIVKFRKFLGVALVAIFIAYLVFTPFQNRINALANPDPYGSIMWRINLWQDSIEFVKEKPVIGHGSGTAKEVILSNRGPQKGSPYPHNDYLKIALEAGLLGLISYLFLIFSLLYILINNYIKTNKTNLKTLLLVLISLTISVYIMSFGDNILRNTSLQWTFWTLMGGLMAVLIKKDPAKSQG